MQQEEGVSGEDRHLTRFLKLAFGFWSGPTRRIAWILALSFLGGIVVNLALNVWWNRWNKHFFDALQNKDVAGIEWNLLVAAVLALLFGIAAIGLLQARMRLQLKWREWLTTTLVDRWLADRRFYKLSILRSIDNPEARIAEDGRVAIELFVDCAGGVINTLLASATFMIVLWKVGGSIEVAGVTIHGYMVVAVVIYTAITTFLMYRLGKPLVACVEHKAIGEGDFRYSLTRTRENAETIALLGGEADERRLLDGSFREVALKWLAVLSRQTRMMFLYNSNSIVAPVVPLMLGAPKLLSGEMSLGDLMQAAAAFGSVQTALNWLADNAMSLANWSAAARRVGALDQAYADLDGVGGAVSPGLIDVSTSPDGSVHLIGVSIAMHNGRVMLSGSDARIDMGEKVILKGASGSGKSTLIRAIAGLWPWGSGQILRPQEASYAFMAQKPYLPLGTLRAAINYPDDDYDNDADNLLDLLAKCGLDHLIPRLDEEDNWSSILSGGEQQRLAFVRVFLKQPDIVIMDEATSALDELSQKCMMEMMEEWLGHSMVLHVAHRPELDKYHTREIVLMRGPGGGPASVRKDGSLARRVGSRIGKVFKRLRRRKRGVGDESGGTADASVGEKGAACAARDERKSAT